MITLLFWFRRPCFFSTILVLSICTITFVKVGMSLSFRQGCENHLRLCRFFSANAFFNMTFLSTLSFSLFFFLTYLLLVYTLLPLLRQECWFSFDTVAMTTYGYVVFSAQMLLSLDILTLIWPYLTDVPKFPHNAVDNLVTFWLHIFVGHKTTQGHGSPSPLLCKPARWGSPPTFRSFTLLHCWSFCLLCYIARLRFISGTTQTSTFPLLGCVVTLRCLPIKRCWVMCGLCCFENCNDVFTCTQQCIQNNIAVRFSDAFVRHISFFVQMLTTYKSGQNHNCSVYKRKCL